MKTDFSKLANSINNTKRGVVFETPKNNYQLTRNNEILESLNTNGYNQLVQPDESELNYVDSIFQNKGFHHIDGVTAESVDLIGKQNFADLNSKLKVFTNSMRGSHQEGVFELITELTKSIDDVNLEDTYNRAVNAKPTFLASFLALFDRNAKAKSKNKQLSVIGELLAKKAGNLEAKLQDIENGLGNKKVEQERAVKMLEDSFKMYYESFIELRKQFILIVYLEKSYTSQLENYRNDISGRGDLMMNQKLTEYERILGDIQNKRLLLHKTLIQLPVTAKQSDTLITVSKNLLKEINNTILISLPTIRGNLVNIGTAITVQKALISNDMAKNLEENTSLMSSKTIGDLAVQGELLSSELRLREASTISTLVTDLKDLKGRLDVAKNQSQQNINSATNILTNATNELKLVLETTN